MMAKKILWIASVSFLGWSVSQASVTSIPTWNYSGGFYCYQPVLTTDGTGAQSVGVSGWQSSFGSMEMTILTSSAQDPTLTINNSINNTSSFAWTEYVVSVAMNQIFTIDSASVSTPPGWTASITAPSGPDISGNYTGTIDYLGGTPVATSGPNNVLDFGYSVTFSGSTSFSLTQTANPVPEPGALNFLMVGGLLAGGWATARRRRAGILVRA
jgi:PEP-CTERM motif